MSTPSIDLILVGADPLDAPAWPAGRVWRCEATPKALSACWRELSTGSVASAFLFWDPRLGTPDSKLAIALAGRRGQVLHGGLLLGTASLPQALDFVSPTWMLNADAASSKECSSWRVSWRACFVPGDVFRFAAGPLPEFDSLAGSALEWGHRLIKSGFVVRYTPLLAQAAPPMPDSVLSLADEFRFLRLRVPRFWAMYAFGRMMLSGFASPFALVAARRAACRMAAPGPSPKFVQEAAASAPAGARVTVLIPTVDRYPYLRTILSQLQTQTVPPYEIIVVDQTEPSRRDDAIASTPSNCPLRVLYLDSPGQCRARNAGLQAAGGDFVLFVDDDDEIESDLLERHLSCLASFQADVSAGVADEAGAGPLPPEFTYLRVSDVFPTNNCMIRTRVLDGSGLFDLAYDRGARADGDLGMRIHLSGALMILNPAISVFHHHAPMGGLRAHKARKITYARSRSSVWHRHLPSATEAYLWGRYFSARQVREEIWLRALGTLAVRGGRLRKLAKLAVGGVLMPHTWWRIRGSLKAAAALSEVHPTIPSLAGGPPATQRTGVPT